MQCRRPCHCRCLAVAVDPADVNVIAAIGVHMLPAVAGIPDAAIGVQMLRAVAGIPDAAGVSAVAGLLAVVGVVPAMSSCMTALFENCVTFNT